MEKFKSLKVRFIIAVICLVWLSLNTMETAAQYVYEKDGIHYSAVQEDELPLWLGIVEDSSHKNLTELDIPDNLTITSRELPAIVEKIGYKAFSVSKIKKINIPSSVTRIDERAFEHSNLEDIVFSNGLVSIGECAFLSCFHLKSLKLPESLKYLNCRCFSTCLRLERVDLPASLLSMGGFTFRYSCDIKDIYCRAEIPPIAHDSDFGIIYNPNIALPELASGPDLYECILHVPAGSIELYRNAPGWNLFQNIVAIEEDATVEEVNTDDSYEYYVNSHMVTIPCIEGDLINVCNSDGICIHTEEMKTDGDYVFTGRGIYIISRNGKSIKVAL